MKIQMPGRVFTLMEYEILSAISEEDKVEALQAWRKTAPKAFKTLLNPYVQN